MHSVIKLCGDGDSRFVYDSHNVEPSNGAGILGGLPLGVVKVGGDSDYRVCDLVSKVSFCYLLHLAQNHGANLLRSKGRPLALDVHLDMRLVVLLVDLERPVLDVMLHGLVVPRSADKTLGVEDCVLWVERQLVLGGVSDQALAIRSESHVRWRDSVALVVGNDLHPAILEHPHTARGGGGGGGGEG